MAEKKVTKKRVVQFGDPLTKREKQVIMMLCEGGSDKFAGKELGITNQAMKNHLSAIYKKLGLVNRTQLALWVQKALVDGKEKV